MGAFFANVIAAIVGNARVLFKYFLFGTFIAVLVAFGTWFLNFLTSVYGYIVGYAGQIVSNSVPSMLGYALSALGIDTFINSAFAVFFSAMAFWLVGVGSVITAKFSIRAYNTFFKALS